MTVQSVGLKFAAVSQSSIEEIFLPSVLNLIHCTVSFLLCCLYSSVDSTRETGPKKIWHKFANN